MFTSIRLFIRHSRQLAVTSSLLFATLVCGGLIVLRVAYAHNQYYSWLVWNLFLAWIPALSALLIYNLRRKKTRWRWLIITACGVCWLIFFPNAPYLLTDLIHLQPRPDAPFWFDLIVLVAFAWTGLGLGVVSLVLMQEV